MSLYYVNSLKDLVTVNQQCLSSFIICINGQIKVILQQNKIDIGVLSNLLVCKNCNINYATKETQSNQFWSV